MRFPGVVRDFAINVIVPELSLFATDPHCRVPQSLSMLHRSRNKRNSMTTNHPNKRKAWATGPAYCFQTFLENKSLMPEITGTASSMIFAHGIECTAPAKDASFTSTVRVAHASHRRDHNLDTPMPCP